MEPRCVAETVPQLIVVQQAAGRVGEVGGVGGGDEAGDTVEHHLGRAPDPRGDRRDPDRGSLDQRDRHPLVVGREHHHVAAGIDLLDIGAPPKEPDPVPERAGPLSQRVEELALPCHEEVCVGVRRGQADRRVDEPLRALHAGEPADEGHHGDIERQAEPLPGLFAARHRREAGAWRHHDVLRPPPHPGVQQLVAHPVAHRDQAGRPARERALDAHHRAGLRRREVAR